MCATAATGEVHDDLTRRPGGRTWVECGQYRHGEIGEPQPDRTDEDQRHARPGLVREDTERVVVVDVDVATPAAATANTRFSTRWSR